MMPLAVARDALKCIAAAFRIRRRHEGGLTCVNGSQGAYQRTVSMCSGTRQRQRSVSSAGAHGGRLACVT
jgi:hypothetical protein